MPQLQFEFDPLRSTTENLASYFKSLEADSPQFAKLLSDNINLMLPLAEVGPARNSSRTKFNEKIQQALTASEAFKNA